MNDTLSILCLFCFHHQVEVANKHVDFHMNKYGYQKSNVNFIHGYMEKLGEAGLKDENYDLIM